VVRIVLVMGAHDQGRHKSDPEVNPLPSEPIGRAREVEYLAYVSLRPEIARTQPLAPTGQMLESETVLVFFWSQKMPRSPVLSLAFISSLCTRLRIPGAAELSRDFSPFPGCPVKRSDRF